MIYDTHHMTPEQWRQMTPGQQAQHVAQFGPPPPGWGAAPTGYAPHPSLGLSSPPKKRRIWPWVAGAFVLFLFVVGVSGHGRSTSTPTDTASASTATFSPGVPTVVKGPAPAAVPAQTGDAAAPASAPDGPATTATEGTYQVGVDITAGRYKTAGPGGNGPFDICYWERARDDSGDFSSVITNDLFKGPGSVTVKKGEFVKLTGACTWTKQG